MAADHVPDLFAALAEAIERARAAQGLPPSTYVIEHDDDADWSAGDIFPGDSVPDDDERPRRLGPPS